MPTTLSNLHATPRLARTLVLLALVLACAPVATVRAAAWTVRFQPGTSVAAHTAVLARHGVAAGTPVGAFHAWEVDVADNPTAPATIAALRAERAVRYVEPAHLDRGLAFAPTDPLYTTDPAAAAGAWQLPRVHAADAWNLDAGGGITGRGVVVAVIDTGVDMNHADLAGRVLPGFNAVTRKVDTSAQQVTADYVGHGTAVSSVIAATASNGIGTVGIAPQALILPVKVMDAVDEFGGEAAADIPDEVRGIHWAVDHGAQVLNLSLGGDDTSRLEAEGIDYAHAHGVVVTCSAGNDGVGHVAYPARYAGCVAVGATNRRGGLTSFSQYGPGIDLVAPGEHVPVDLPDYIERRGFAYWDGTSFSAPIVAGAAALLVGRGLRGDAAVQALTSRADDLGASGYDTRTGWGLVDVAKAAAVVPAPAAHPADHAPSCPTFVGTRAVVVRPALTTQVPIACAEGDAGEFVTAVGTSATSPTPAGVQVVPTADVAFTGTWYVTPPAGFTRETIRTTATDGVSAPGGGSIELSSPARRLSKSTARAIVVAAIRRHARRAHEGTASELDVTCRELSAVRWQCTGSDWLTAASESYGTAVVTVARVGGAEVPTTLFFGDRATLRCLGTSSWSACAEPAFWRE